VLGTGWRRVGLEWFRGCRLGLPEASIYVRVVVNRLAYKFYEGPVTFYGDRAILCFC